MIRTRLQGGTPFFPNMLNNGNVEVCLKEDVDKVIVEKDKAIADLEESHKKEVGQLLMEIVKLKDKLQNVSELLKETREMLIESQKMHKRCADGAIKKIRHRNFKWCKAMEYVEWLKQMILCNYPKSILFRRAARRERKWKELAEKFKRQSDERI